MGTRGGRSRRDVSRDLSQVQAREGERALIKIPPCLVGDKAREERLQRLRRLLVAARQRVCLIATPSEGIAVESRDAAECQTATVPIDSYCNACPLHYYTTTNLASQPVGAVLAAALHQVALSATQSDPNTKQNSTFVGSQERGTESRARRQ